MSECLSMDAIARPAGLSPAEREHAAACPRCAVRVAQFGEFVEGRVEVAPAEFADAQARLGEFLEARLGLDVAAAESPAPRAAARPPAWSRLAAWLSAPAGRMAVGFAALAIVAGGVWALRPTALVPAVERGEALTAMVIDVRADESAHAVALSWGAAPGADQYRVDILSAELEPLASLGPVAQPAFTLSRGAVSGQPPGTTVYCRVVARRAGVPLAESELASLRLP